MKCTVCGKILEGRKGKKFCSLKCTRAVHAKKIPYLSTKLRQEHLDKIYAIQAEILKQIELEEVEERYKNLIK